MNYITLYLHKLYTWFCINKMIQCMERLKKIYIDSAIKIFGFQKLIFL